MNYYNVKNLLKRLEKASQFYIIYKDYPEQRDEIIKKATPLIKKLASEGISQDSAGLFFYLGNNPDHDFLQEHNISLIGKFSETVFPIYVKFNTSSTTPAVRDNNVLKK